MTLGLAMQIYTAKRIHPMITAMTASKVAEVQDNSANASIVFLHHLLLGKQSNLTLKKKVYNCF